MADTKITALDALTAADPANDVLPIVDVNDTFMAASGTTKKISINNILGASGTATLASATISGDLTVDTNTLFVDSANNRVGIGTASPSVPLHILNNTAATNTAVDVLLISQTSTGTPASGLGGGLLFRSQRPSGGLILNRGAIYGVSGADPDDDGDLAFYTLTNTGPTGFTEKYRLDSNGVATWSNVGGVAGTAMTLNSTGLGVGGPPAAGMLLTVGATSSVSATANAFQILSNKGTFNVVTDGSTNAAGTTIIYSWANGGQGPLIFRNASISNVMTLDASGNVGIGVTTPTSQLTVGTATANPAATVAFHKSTANEYRLKLTSGSFNSNGNWIGLGLGYSSDYMKVAIIAEAKDGNGRGNLHFALNDAVTSANASIADARMTLKSTGQVRFVPLAADPAGAEAGDVYYNSTSNKLKCYNGTTWNDLF